MDTKKASFVLFLVFTVYTQSKGTPEQVHSHEHQETPAFASNNNQEKLSNRGSTDAKIKFSIANNTLHPIKILVKNRPDQQEKILIQTTINPKNRRANQTLRTSIRSSYFPLRMHVMHDGLRSIKGTVSDPTPLLDKVLITPTDKTIEISYNKEGQLKIQTKIKGR